MLEHKMYQCRCTKTKTLIIDSLTISRSHMTKVKYYVAVNKSFVRTSQNERDGMGGELKKGRSCQGRREKRQKAAKNLHNFSREHLDPPIVSILTRVRIGDVRRTERLSLDHINFLERSAVRHATTRYSLRKGASVSFFLIFFSFFSFMGGR